MNARDKRTVLRVYRELMFLTLVFPGMFTSIRRIKENRIIYTLPFGPVSDLECQRTRKFLAEFIPRANNQYVEEGYHMFRYPEYSQDARPIPIFNLTLILANPCAGVAGVLENCVPSPPSMDYGFADMYLCNLYNQLQRWGFAARAPKPAACITLD